MEKQKTKVETPDEVIDLIIFHTLSLNGMSMTGLQWKLQHKLSYYLNKYKTDVKQLTLNKDE